MLRAGVGRGGEELSGCGTEKSGKGWVCTERRESGYEKWRDIVGLREKMKKVDVGLGG